MQKVSTELSLEVRIIRLLWQRDKSSLALIYKHYRFVLYNQILRIVGYGDIAEDVLQDGLLKIWEHGQAYDEKKGSLYTWMSRICRNAAIDKTRSKSYKAMLKSKDSIDFVIKEEPVDDHEEKLLLHESIGQLPKGQAIVIQMAYFQGYTQVEIAEKLNIPLGTVKTRIRLAISKLRAII